MDPGIHGRIFDKKRTAPGGSGQTRSGWDEINGWKMGKTWKPSAPLDPTLISCIFVCRFLGSIINTS